MFSDVTYEEALDLQGTVLHTENPTFVNILVSLVTPIPGGGYTISFTRKYDPSDILTMEIKDQFARYVSPLHGYRQIGTGSYCHRVLQVFNAHIAHNRPNRGLYVPNVPVGVEPEGEWDVFG